MSDRFNLNLSGTFLEDLELDWDSFTSKLGNWLSTLFPQVLELTKSITNGVISFVVALVLSVYMLLNKEKLIRQIRKFCYAYFKKPGRTGCARWVPPPTTSSTALWPDS